jgi:hypothetical protein
MSEKNGALSRKRQPPSPTNKKKNANVPLQLCDGSANCWLGHAKSFRSCGEAAGIDNGHKNFEFAQIHEK